MNAWKLYDHHRWAVETCRQKIDELRASKQYSEVKLGAARMYHGKAFYHILVLG